MLVSFSLFSLFSSRTGFLFFLLLLCAGFASACFSFFLVEAVRLGMGCGRVEERVAYPLPRGPCNQPTPVRLHCDFAPPPSDTRRRSSVDMQIMVAVMVYSALLRGSRLLGSGGFGICVLRWGL